MLKFTNIFTIDDIEEKTITKKDGEPFTFTEARLAYNGKKGKTIIVARVPQYILPEFRQGRTLNMDIVISHYESAKGIFNRFEVKKINGMNPAMVTTYSEDDEIPF